MGSFHNLDFFSNKTRIFWKDNYVENEPVMQIRKETKPIDYWNLFAERCLQESKNIQRNNWISADDIESMTSNSIIAIPGTILILYDY